MKRLVIILVLSHLVIMGCGATEYSREGLFNVLQSMKSQEEANTVFSDYLLNSPDLELAFQVYNMWKRGSQTEADKALESMKNDSAKHGRYQYFEGLKIENLVDRIAFARKMIETNKDSIEGYALMFDTYSMWVFQESLGKVSRQGGPSEAEIQALKDGFSEDNLKMVRIRDWKEAKEHLNLCYKYMAYYAVFKNHPDDAYKYMKLGDEMGADWVNYYHLAIQAVRNKKIDEAKIYAEKEVEKYVKQRNIKPEQKKAISGQILISILINGNAYEEAIKEIKSNPGHSEDMNLMYNLACVYSRKGSVDEAFESLNKALELGYSSVQQLQTDTDLNNIRGEKNWDALIKKAESNVKKAALKQKIEKNAPDWELKDPQGKTYKLSDYKGKKVIVLDFWATWCGPCMMAMPELDKWCKSHKPEDVVVFSINTWERQKDKALKLFEEKNYAMKLLMDGDASAKQYGVTGIPYICVIDKAGNIRYEVKGFDQQLESNLTLWVKDLLE